MGYSIYFINGRDCGYDVPAVCESPKCNKEIDRGMGYCCGGSPDSEFGCNLYFCGEHLFFRNARGEGYVQNCYRCSHYKPPYKEKPDVKEWVEWKLNDESWAQWRKENKEKVEKMKKLFNPSPK